MNRTRTDLVLPVRHNRPRQLRVHILLVRHPRSKLLVPDNICQRGPVVRGVVPEYFAGFGVVGLELHIVRDESM